MDSTYPVCTNIYINYIVVIKTTSISKGSLNNIYVVLNKVEYCWNCARIMEQEIELASGPNTSTFQRFGSTIMIKICKLFLVGP